MKNPAFPRSRTGDTMNCDTTRLRVNQSTVAKTGSESASASMT